MMATLCSCLRNSDGGRVVVPDPDCPAYALHAQFPEASNGPLVKEKP